jgi:hypothetical protein
MRSNQHGNVGFILGMLIKTNWVSIQYETKPSSIKLFSKIFYLFIKSRISIAIH